MKALTITEPWASLICCGAKTLETRSWSTKYRGPIAIHAAKTLPKQAAELLFDDDAFMDAFDRAGIHPLTGEQRPQGNTGFDWLLARSRRPTSLMATTRGRVIATAELIGCYRTEFVTAHCSISAQEKAFGDYMPGRFAFRLTNVVRLPKPIPATGALSLWDFDDALLAEAVAA